ncbi:MAG: DNA primase [Candidatus Omnitrophota bacterium]|jgi:DNA primase
MPGLIPENILDDILSRVNIAEVISEYIPLKRAGRNFKALCPFHHEKTPSFMVSPDRQIYHCFGCGQSGNAFKFLMQYERIEFPEAVEILAKKAGVILPEIKKQDNQTQSLVSQLYKVNEQAAYFYEQALYSRENEQALNYLLKRNIKKETMKLFRLGFAPDRWDVLMSYLRQKAAGLSLQEKAGLIVSKPDGGYHDRFKNRITFPILDVKSRVIAFGARIFADKDNKLAKYVNSPETFIYTKGKNLYGLNLAKDAIRERDYAVIVEGNLDCIMPYQEGLRNIVASLGTALTEEQVRLLKRYTQNAVMIYDADNAGQNATLRSLGIFLEEDMNVRIVALPEGLDPDLFVRKYGIRALEDEIEKAKGLFDYQLGVLESRYDIGKEEGKRKIFDEMLITIKKVKNGILRSEYIKRLAEHADVPEFEVRDEFNKLKDGRLRPDSYRFIERGKAANINPTEKLLIKLMLEENELIEHIRQHLEPADFQDERTARIVSVMFDLISQGKVIETSKLLNYLDDEDTLKYICESAFKSEVSSENKEKVIDDCIRLIKNKRLLLARQRLQEEIEIAEGSGDEEKLNKLKTQFSDLLKKR